MITALCLLPSCPRIGGHYRHSLAEIDGAASAYGQDEIALLGFGQSCGNAVRFLVRKSGLHSLL